MSIVNITQHQPTTEQIEAGVVNDANWEEIKSLLNFSELPSAEEISARAGRIAKLVACYNTAMIGGAPFFMAPLQAALENEGVEVVYSYSQRVSVESTNENGDVVKTSVFKHAGFVRT